MKQTSNGSPVPNDLLFVRPSGPSCVLRQKSASKRSSCIRRPRHGGMQTSTRPRAFVHGAPETGLVPKFHECVSVRSRRRGLSSRTGRTTRRGFMVGMSGNEGKWEEGDVERVGKEDEYRRRVNDAAGDEGSALRDAFSGSREEWGGESFREGPNSDVDGECYNGWQGSDVAASSYAEWAESEIVDEAYTDGKEREEQVRETVVANGKRRTNDRKEETLTVISGPDLMKRFLGVPGYLLRELVLPISEVGSVLWYDMKMSVIDGLKGERGYFIDDAVDCDADYAETAEEVADMDIDEEQLSVEERQILEVQQSAMRTADKIQGTMIRLFGRFF